MPLSQFRSNGYIAIILLLLYLIQCSCSSQHKESSAPIIKRIVEYSYMADLKDGIPKKALYYLKTITIFNRQGKPTSDTFYNKGTEIAFYNSFRYDSNKKERIAHLYNHAQSNRTIWVYANGRKTEEYRYSHDNTLVYKSSYIYNSLGQMSEQNEYQVGSNKLNMNVRYQYNKKGELIRIDQKDYQYANTGKITYTYDQPDRNGNWQRKITIADTTLFGQPSNITERTIEYY